MWTVNYILLKSIIALMRILICMEGSELFNTVHRMHLHTWVLNQGALPGYFRKLLSCPAQNTPQPSTPDLGAMWQEVCLHTTAPCGTLQARHAPKKHLKLHDPFHSTSTAMPLFK